MEMPHLGVALIVFIFAITLYQTNTLLDENAKYQSISSANINDHLTGATLSGVNFDLDITRSVKSSKYTKDYPCDNF